MATDVPVSDPVERSRTAEARRLGIVAPADWVNPEPQPHYHLVVIGAGTAGLVSAAAAAGLGARVALVERHQMGGDCLNVGCVPSKGLIAGGRAWAAVRQARAFGLETHVARADAREVFARMRELRAGIAPVDGAVRFRDLGVDVFLGDGAFASRDAVTVTTPRGTQTLRFGRAVIATGARAALPPTPGLGEIGAHTNETIFELHDVPSRLLVIGAGPIGCELAQAFARLGSAVTLLTDTPTILPREMPAAAAVVADALARDGIRIITDARITAAARSGDERMLAVTHASGPETLGADAVLVAAGRTPNIESLGLDRAGVLATPRGIETDDFLRTANRRIYAAGDVAARWQFTHAADFMARTVVRNALFFGRARVSRLVVPWVTYTSPEVAHVGLTHAEAAAAGDAVTTLVVPMHDNDRAVLDGESDGFLALHLRAGTDRILGGTLVAPHAGEMIGELALAVTHGIGLATLATTIHPYPTQAEIFRKAGDLWNRGRLTPGARRLFATYFHWRR